MGLDTKYDIDQMMEEWRINGFVVFEDLIPTETVDRILEAWIPVRDRDIERQGKYPPRGYHRYNVRVPFDRPFVDPQIFEHPALVAFLERVLGPDYVWTHFDSNIPLPGTDYQRWHRDGKASLFPGIKTPAFSVGVKFPLVDTNEENGSFEVIPGTQYVGEEGLPANLNDVFGEGLNRRGNYHPVRLNLKKGSLWVQDHAISTAAHRIDQTTRVMNCVWHSASRGCSANGCMITPISISHGISGKACPLMHKKC